MLYAILLLVGGFTMLGVGAELMVGGSSRLALRLGISPLVVGLTIVAFGTSAPELAVSIKSTASDHSALALGNVIGSNIANIGLVLGITALLSPIRIERQLVKKQIPLLIISSVLLGVMLSDGQLDLVDGILLSSGLVGYLLFSYGHTGAGVDPEEPEIDSSTASRQAGSTSLNIVWIVAGLGLLVFGSQVFVDNAVVLAQLIGFSEAVIGLTLVAVGTSIPEFATCLVAIMKKQSDIAIGNIIGSNLFNILGVLGISALAGTIYTEQFGSADFVVMLLFSLILLPLAWTSFTLSRIEGWGLLVSYFAYIAFVFLQA